jgi:N-acetylmuramoyl-L-alanine amidase
MATTRVSVWQGLWLLLSLLAMPPAVALELADARLWPSPDYTRLTLEAPAPVKFTTFTLNQPERLVIDLEDVTLGEVLAGLPAKVLPDDPLVSEVRIALNRPGVVRLVLVLKQAAHSTIFTLKPLADYGYRLVIDLRPASLPVAPPVAAQPAPPAAPDASAQATPQPVSPSRRAYTRLVTVAIDAGHGGEDPGARGAAGSREKDITLSIARRLKARIDAQENMRAVLIRDGDYFIPLHERVNKARRAQADLFVSVHADAFIKPSARGSSVFALSPHGASSAAARWLAKKENEADLVGGINIDVEDPYLKRTLIDLSQTATISDSLKVGSAVLKEIGGINTLHKSYVEQAGFAVLKAPDMPSILVETAFISNPEEERRLNDAGYQDRLADAIVDGIKAHFRKYPPSGKQRSAQDM